MHPPSHKSEVTDREWQALTGAERVLVLLAFCAILRIDRLRRRVFPPDFRPFRFMVIHSFGLMTALFTYPPDGGPVDFLSTWATSIFLTLGLYAAVGLTAAARETCGGGGVIRGWPLE